MTRISSLFFAAGTVCVLIGMVWGIQMSASGDHRLSSAHAHLNLVGFVLMSVFGAYYALSPTQARTLWAKLHLAVHLLAVVTLVPGIVMALTGGGDALAKGGSVLAVASVVLFLTVILRDMRSS